MFVLSNIFQLINYELGNSSLNKILDLSKEIDFEEKCNLDGESKD